MLWVGTTTFMSDFEAKFWHLASTQERKSINCIELEIQSKDSTQQLMPASEFCPDPEAKYWQQEPLTQMPGDDKSFLIHLVHWAASATPKTSWKGESKACRGHNVRASWIKKRDSVSSTAKTATKLNNSSSCQGIGSAYFLDYPFIFH